MNPVEIVLFLNIFAVKMLLRCLFHKISTSNFIVISKKKLTTEKMLRTVREVADAENGSAFLNIEFNGSAKSTEKAPLVCELK